MGSLPWIQRTELQGWFWKSTDDGKSLKLEFPGCGPNTFLTCRMTDRQYCHPHLLKHTQGIHCAWDSSEQVHLDGNGFCPGQTQRSRKILAGDHSHCPPCCPQCL